MFNAYVRIRGATLLAKLVKSEGFGIRFSPSPLTSFILQLIPGQEPRPVDTVEFLSLRAGIQEVARQNRKKLRSPSKRLRQTSP